jgi:hypothetical protein
MKILHITHHLGCKIAIDFVGKKLNLEIETQFADWNYNMSKELADEIWNKYKNFYESFDVIITSDTASIARIFLQNNYKNKLIIWVCNRFDYADQATNKVGFPDTEFYELFNSIPNRPNVIIRSYTKFEHEYAKKWRNVIWSDEVIRPCNFDTDNDRKSGFPENIDKSSVFLITRYHNDNILLDLKKICDDLEIPSWRGNYNGPTDLKGIKGIIHIPYAWSNLALFENWAMCNIYFIPTKKFLIELSKSSKFFWSPPFSVDFLESSEWYLPEHQELFIYFDNFDDLKKLTLDDELIKDKKNKIIEFSNLHIQKTIKQWKDILMVSTPDV